MTDTEQRVLTPTTGRVLRRAAFWVGAAVFALAIAIISLLAAGSAGAGRPLDSTNAAPAGAMALAEVLRQQGLEVTATDTLDETREAIDAPDQTTLLVYDLDLYLDDAQLREAVSLAGTVVLVDPGFGQLQAIAPGVAQAGVVNEALEADCDVPAVQKAGTVSGEAVGYRIVDDTAGATGCLGSGDGVVSLVALPDGLVILGTTGALSNEAIIRDGNAALALNLLGAHEHLVWYLPTFADLPATAPETLGELTPAWVTPVLSLLVLAFVAAAIWRGRRLGPLVIENLPVTVRSSETMLGRARLYEKSSSRLRALDALRVGALQRLAIAGGLPRVASVDEVVTAIAELTGAQVADIRSLLVDAVPATDAELVAYSDALLRLERDVAAATRP
ncbi:MAG: DUF4350 domain-containing protein [Rhodoglobus sp.]